MLSEKCRLHKNLPITDLDELMQELIDRDDENTEPDDSENGEEIDNDPAEKVCIEMIKQLKRRFIFNKGDIPDSLTAVEKAVFKLLQRRAWRLCNIP